MATHRYKSSKTGIKVLAWLFTIIFLLMAIISITPQTTVVDLIKGTTMTIAMIGFLLFSFSRCYIEINEAKRTIMYCNWPMKSEPVSIDKIIQVGYPEQNYVVKSLDSFIYIWYDDPKKPGKDKYVKIKDAQFDPQTIVQVATDLKKLNPQIKFDDKLKELAKS